MTEHADAEGGARSSAASSATPACPTATATATASAAQPRPPPPRTPPANASADDAVNLVLAVSVDGLSSRVIRDLGPEKTPALHRILAEGPGTLNARTERE